MELNFRSCIIFAQVLLSVHFLCFAYAKRKLYPLRLALTSLPCLAYSLLVDPTLAESEGLEIFFSSLFYLSFALLSYLGILICYKAPKKELLFSLLSGYTIQHVLYLLFSLVDTPLAYYKVFPDGFYGNNVFIRRATITPLFPLFLYFPYRWIKSSKGEYLPSKTILAIAGISLFADIIFSLFIGNDLPLVTQEICKAINLLCCGLILFLLFYLRKSTLTEKDNILLREMVKEEKRHFKRNQQTQAVLDMKYHDLKNQIHAIGKEKYIPEETMDEMEKALSVYDSNIETGRVALDLILSEKMLLAGSEGIELNILADGRLLSFMKDGDLFSLFGNLVDNAIEASKKIKEKERRLISLRVRKASDLVFIKVSNQYDGEIELKEDGLPKTSKEGDGHGIGMKSIRFIAEKYDGQMSINAEGHTFSVTLSFLPESVEDFA